ncbi:E3 ubiquitin-protein ligase LRSAM1-like isoform X2 [Onthophagus taurus]|uniref:E3 ubiquitin-protein ligase LRSAM1-like isoform X2 n=1 Tax=Onthophagus taurus TaxID=166361 RepID=UPI000C206B63|nr:E3 ubiquitin-protein ligase LRSAM1-like isoform X2 [Onthophagus taurus]
MFRRNKKEHKAKLEHKLYLARETPEPIFDLSECGLDAVPSGIYSLCRVFLKEYLKLENNNLSSLSGGGNLQDLSGLKLLDIHCNEFTELPNQIEWLTNLKVLYANNNHIKKLPASLCNLINLQILDLSNNKLQMLPDNLGNLKQLKELHLNGNKHLKKLPKTTCQLKSLIKLELDIPHYIYPPQHILNIGLKEIMDYIHADNDCSCDKNKLVSSNPALEDNKCDDYLNLDELNFQEQKRFEFLEIERQNDLMQKQELELANAMKIDKKKLLEDITEQQNKLDHQLIKIHNEREIDRFRLMEQLHDVEENADVAINKLLTSNREPLAYLIEQEQVFEEKMLQAALESNSQLLCKQDILSAMQELIEYETAKFQEFSSNKNEITRSILEEELKNNQHLTDLLESQNLRQSELVDTLQNDSELQKAAVGTLLEKSDARIWGLVQQVRLVESQLAALTSIELDRKKLKIDKQINDLAEKRCNLSLLLMQLLEEQNVRRTQLLSTIKTLELNTDNSEDYWLRQYQQILDHLPKGIVEAQNNMNPNLVEALLMEGVLHCIPFLSKWANDETTLLNVTAEELKAAGINNQEDCTNILNAFHLYNKQKYQTTQVDGDKLPSAPIMEVEEASAPPEDFVAFVSSECVICLHLACQIIFVPCGHFCCCNNCSLSVSDCPLCRSTIKHKIRTATS